MGERTCATDRYERVSTLWALNLKIAVEVKGASPRQLQLAG